MAKWIELNSGRLLNLDRVGDIAKFQYTLYGKLYYSIIYDYDTHPDCGYMEEKFDKEEKRDKRFEEIKAMLIGN